MGNNAEHARMWPGDGFGDWPRVEVVVEEANDGGGKSAQWALTLRTLIAQGRARDVVLAGDPKARWPMVQVATIEDLADHAVTQPGGRVTRWATPERPVIHRHGEYRGPVAALVDADLRRHQRRHESAGPATVGEIYGRIESRFTASARLSFEEVEAALAMLHAAGRARPVLLTPALHGTVGVGYVTDRHVPDQATRPELVVLAVAALAGNGGGGGTAAGITADLRQRFGWPDGLAPTVPGVRIALAVAAAYGLAVSSTPDTGSGRFFLPCYAPRRTR